MALAHLEFSRHEYNWRAHTEDLCYSHFEVYGSIIFLDNCFKFTGYIFRLTSSYHAYERTGRITLIEELAALVERCVHKTPLENVITREQLIRALMRSTIIVINILEVHEFA